MRRGVNIFAEEIFGGLLMDGGGSTFNKRYGGQTFQKYLYNFALISLHVIFDLRSQNECVLLTCPF